MTVTVSIDGGPTVRLAYDPRQADERVPGWTHQNEIVVACTTVSLEQQLAAPAPTWLKNLLVGAVSYLFQADGSKLALRVRAGLLQRAGRPETAAPTMSNRSAVLCCRV